MTQQQTADNEHLVSVRETFESVWIAIVLAFVLRAFVIEAFVIPTGSMAPRLMGRHWEFDCPACGYHYTVGIENQSDVNDLKEKQSGRPAVCPNCRYQYDFAADWAVGGDRVLVLKYLYRFREPRPWDVVVFKNPQDNEQNYIKRLIGLPGQMLEIIHGDVYVRHGKDLNGDGVIDESDFYYFADRQGVPLAEWLNDTGAVQKYLVDPKFNEAFPARVLTKSAETQRVMWQTVFDNDYQPDQVVYNGQSGQAGQPGRGSGPRQEWQEPWNVAGPAWQKAQRQREFRFIGSREFAPVKFSDAPEYFWPTNPYNAGYVADHSVNSDLKLSFTYVPDSADSSVALHLSAFEDHFLATVSAQGQCVLTHGQVRGGRVEWDKKPLLGPVMAPGVKPGEPAELALSLADYRVTLWVHDKAVLVTTPEQYNPTHNLAQMRAAAVEAQKKMGQGNFAAVLAEDIRRLTPVPTVEALGQGGPCRLRHVRLSADVYYTQASLERQDGPPGHAVMSHPMVLRKFGQEPDDRDEFFVLGDNSPQSMDGRMWGHHAPTLRPGYRDGTVARYAMIGKAFFVYWPGGFRAPMVLPRDGSIKPAYLPYIPNAGRMRLIR